MDLCEKGYNVIVFDNFRTGNIKNVHKSAKIIKGDICKKKDLDKAFRQRIDIVYHFAALLSQTASKNPNLATKINEYASQNLIDCAIKHGLENNIKVKFIDSIFYS